MSDATIDVIDAAIALHAGEGNPLTVLQHLQPLVEPSPRLMEALFEPAVVADMLQGADLKYRQQAFAQYITVMYARRGWQTHQVTGQWLLWNGGPFPATLMNTMMMAHAPVEEVRGAAAVFGLVVLPATPDSHWWRVCDPGPVRPPERRWVYTPTDAERDAAFGLTAADVSREEGE